ncbi:hypothetical protein PAESOLCIP111_02567 [Paenibacillus solanacearum]|uniref:Glucosyl-3-phosphoglycerate synthase n=1 Tax=Paenibacillus solanacearum TaxID=2048548 RepID=A0A916K2D4_9BACL|nr:glycosyltransferase [Paenibacillus solanacearum]CAG7623836.1 hypothetical protein PAESOLCIP111_02567 [Paenibacillus solanacearum]
MTQHTDQPDDRISEPLASASAEIDTKPKVSVVIPAMNEMRTIDKIVHEARSVHPLTEVIVIDNGSQDGTAMIAAQAGARVIRYAAALGHDVGRSIGAREARGDIILFTDGDIVIGANNLIPFVEAVDRGVDVALNMYEGKLRSSEITTVALCKKVLNAMLQRSDLGGSSLTTIPHAMSRRALNIIGLESLAVPPKAQAIAITKGLLVQPVHFVDVGAVNPKRRKKPDPLVPLITGDHLEAIHWLLSQEGPRANFSDLGRKRERVVD